MRRRNSIHEPPSMNIMLLGSTGSGKSASGNTIIGIRETFKEDFSPESVTRTCESAQTELDGQTITVIDTVGLSDTSVKITDAQTQIEQILQSTCDVIDVFLLVIELGETFTEENSKVVQWIQNNFGATFSNHTIVLFTHGDQLHEPIEDYLGECETLRSVVGQCSGGYHVFNNNDEDRSQVTELLEKIESLRIKNAYKRYTEQGYKETQKALLLKKCAAGAAAAVVGLAGAAAAVAGAAAAGGLAGAAAAVVGVAGAAAGGLAGAAAAVVGVAAAAVGAMGVYLGVGGGAAGGGAAMESARQCVDMASASQCAYMESARGGAAMATARQCAAMAQPICLKMAQAIRGAAMEIADIVASMMGTVLTAGQAALIGAAALAAVAVGAGVYFLARKNSSKEKDKRN